MKKIYAPVIALAVAAAAPAFAQSQPGDIRPESDTLPVNVARFRVIYGYGWGNQMFDKDGKKQDALVEFTKSGGAAVIEYGVTDKISAQFLAPFAFEPSYEVNKESNDPNVKGAILLLGEKGIEDFAEKTKASGIGDIEVGLKYKFSTVEEPIFVEIPFYASLALGLRMNTSGYKDATKDGKLPVGRGTNDLGIRLNADYGIVQGLMLQVENQTEFMVMKGETYSSGKKVDFERDGIRNVGYGKLVVAPGAWYAPIDVLSFGAKYAYNFDAKTKTDGKSVEGAIAPESQSLVTSASLNGFVHGIPLQFDVDYTVPVSGKGNLDNYRLSETPVAASVAATLKAFYKF